MGGDVKGQSRKDLAAVTHALVTSKLNYRHTFYVGVGLGGHGSYRWGRTHLHGFWGGPGNVTG